MAGPFPGWTTHGHPIPGAARSEDMRPPIARCGGPRLCMQCAREARPSRVPHDQDDSTIRGLLRAEEVLRGIEHHWPADSVAQAIAELRSLRELRTEAETDDDDEEGGEKP